MAIDYDDWFACDECKGLGDDYYWDDENDELVSACEGCIHNLLVWDED